MSEKTYKPREVVEALAKHLKELKEKLEKSKEEPAQDKPEVK